MAEAKKITLKPYQFRINEKGESGFKLFLLELYQAGILKEDPAGMVVQEITLTVTEAQPVTDYTYW